jgi:hypothetical protein
MTEDELDRIEAQLEIKLPLPYRQLVAPWPVRATAGNDDQLLWDRADALIAANFDLHGDTYDSPWPKRYFMIGRSFGRDCYAIDLEDPAVSVLWVANNDVDDRHNGKKGPLAAWAGEYFMGLREELGREGIDPDAAMPSTAPTRISTRAIAVLVGVAGLLGLWLYGHC